MSSKRIRPKRDNVKNLKRKLRNIVMANQPTQLVQPNGTPAQVAPSAPPQPAVLSHKQSYQQVTSFLGQLLNQFTFPGHQIVSARLEAVFNDLRKFVGDRLAAELIAGEEFIAEEAVKLTAPVTPAEAAAAN